MLILDTSWRGLNYNCIVTGDGKAEPTRDISFVGIQRIASKGRHDAEATEQVG